MSIKVLSACLLVVIASIGLSFINGSPQQVAERQIPELAHEPAVAQEHPEAEHFGSTPSADQPSSVAVEPGKVGYGSTEMAINFEAGENDPGIIALAKEAGATPRCLVEELRAYMELLEYMETNPQFNPVHHKYEYAGHCRT